MTQLESLAKESLPETMSITFSGEAATLEAGESGFYLVFGLALLVVFQAHKGNLKSAIEGLPTIDGQTPLAFELSYSD